MTAGTLKVLEGPIKPPLWIRIAHRFQERLRIPYLRRLVARALALFRPRLDVEQNEAHGALARDGLACFPEFIGRAQALELRRLLEGYTCVDPWKPQVGHFRYDAAPAGTHVADIPEAPNIQALHELALDSRLLEMAAAYFGCRPYLDSSIQVWWSLAGNEVPEEAENFHRDNDSIRFLKFFLYLTDVGDENGPHEFVLGSHREGKLLERRRYTDQEVEEAFGKERIRVMTGNAGDGFMEDTWGMHKGRLPRTGIRLLAQFRYSICPTVFRSHLIVERKCAYDPRLVTPLLYRR